MDVLRCISRYEAIYPPPLPPLSTAPTPAPAAAPAQALESSLNSAKPSDDLSLLFETSSKLSTESVLAFVRALCQVSIDELKDAKNPRVSR